MKSIPENIYKIWSILFVLVMMITIPASFKYASHPWTPYIKVIIVFLYGYLFIAVLTTIFFWKWFLKNWYINTFIFFIAGCFAATRLSEPEIVTSYHSHHKIKNDEIETMEERYNHSDQISSKKYWKNGKKDSVWVFYDKNGDITLKQIYRNDTLITSTTGSTTPP